MIFRGLAMKLRLWLYAAVVAHDSTGLGIGSSRRLEPVTDDQTITSLFHHVAARK